MGKAHRVHLGPIVNGRAKYNFESKTALEGAVRGHLIWIREHGLINQEFDSDFLQAVINGLHQDVIDAGLRCTGKFKLLDYFEQRRQGLATATYFRGGQLMTGFFAPINEWHDVTVYPWKKTTKDLKNDGFRLLSSKFIPSPTDQDQCSVAGCSERGYALEYHHIRPTFDEISNRCVDLCTPEDIETSFGYRKFQRPGVTSIADVIPLDHPVAVYLKNVHRDNQWSWLCKSHHAEQTWNR